MARIHVNLSSIIAGTRARAVVPQRALEALDLAAGGSTPQGPGWFDSSWELSRGLEVREGLPGDARPNE